MEATPEKVGDNGLVGGVDDEEVVLDMYVDDALIDCKEGDELEDGWESLKCLATRSLMREMVCTRHNNQQRWRFQNRPYSPRLEL